MDGICVSGLRLAPGTKLLVVRVPAIATVSIWRTAGEENDSPRKFVEPLKSGHNLHVHSRLIMQRLKGIRNSRQLTIDLSFYCHSSCHCVVPRYSLTLR
jgi:hypothetical protein